MLSVKNRQRIRISTGPVAPGPEEVVHTVMPGNGCVSQFKAGKQRTVALPFVGKSNALIDRDIPMLRTLRDHP